MTLCGMDVLLVGQGFESAQALIDRLQRRGFRCHFASDLKTACQLFKSQRVDMVLSSTHLPDGTGFGLLGVLAGQPVTAFLCLSVETSCFWLPAIDAGRDCLGLPALRPSEFTGVLEEMTRCWRRVADDRLRNVEA
jgi:response regulator RpfG family c-di-GMP phosphodiesterase